MTVERIEEQIRKLLALAGDSAASEHEAASAAAAAQRLMIKYQIDKSRFEQDPSNPVEAEPIEKEILFSTDGGNLPRWQAILAETICPFFYCDTYFQSRKGIVVVGRKHDRQTVMYLFAYLKRTLTRLCEESWKKNQRTSQVEGREYKRAFYVAACNVIHGRMALEYDHAMLDSAVTTETALALRNRLATVQDYLRGANPDLGKVRTTVKKNEGYHAGTVAGHAVRLHGDGPGLESGARRLGDGK